MLGMLKQSAAETSLERQVRELNLRLAAAEQGRMAGYVIAGAFLLVKILSLIKPAKEKKETSDVRA